MSTDFLHELLPLPAAAKLLPKNCRGKSPSVQTLRRWAKRGSRNVYLELTFMGGRAYTSRQALSDFIARRNSMPSSIINPSSPTGSARAEAKLKRLGA